MCVPLPTADWLQATWLQRHLNSLHLGFNDTCPQRYLTTTTFGQSLTSRSQTCLIATFGNEMARWPASDRFFASWTHCKGKNLWSVRTNDEWSSTRWAGSLAVRRLVICTKMNKMETIPAENKTLSFHLSQRKLFQILRNFRSEKCKILVKFK